MFALLTGYMEGNPTVKREGTGARVKLGELGSLYMSMDALKEFVNDAADVLDVWFDEQEQKAAS